MSLLDSTENTETYLKKTLFIVLYFVVICLEITTEPKSY